MSIIEIKTLKDLKNLVIELRNLNKRKYKIFNDDDLSKNEMTKRYARFKKRLEEIEATIEHYKTVFIVKRKDLDLFNRFQKKGIEIVYNHHFSQKEILQEHFYGYNSMYHVHFHEELEIPFENEKIIIPLIDYDSHSAFYCDEFEYLIGNYNLNVLALLANTDYKFSKLIEHACWCAIANKYKEKRLSIIETKNGDKNLLVKKLEILQNEELRNKEITSLQNQIESIDKEVSIIENDELNVEINN